MSWTSEVKRKLVVAGAGIVAIIALLALRAVVADQPLERLSRVEGSALETFRGSWHFPRGGPYVLGTQCDKLCELRVDGKRVTRGTGVKLKRIVFAAGIYSVELSREAGSRLLWHPPGRRGPAEYVPASSLSASAPAGASFGAGAGAARLDGSIALAILLIIIGIVTFLLRGVLTAADPRERSRWLEVAAVFAVALAVRLIGLGDAGQTWDEDTNWSAGKNYVTNLLNLDFRGASWIWNLEHPPLMKYVAGIGAQFADGYGPARAASALMMSVACALLVPVAARIGHARAGLYAGVVAALTPHLIGHGQIVGHESAMALTWMLAITAAVCVWPTGSRARLETRLAVVGAAVGLAIAARFANGLVGPLVYAIVVLRAPAERRLETAWKAAVIMPAAAMAVFVLLWPRMWQAPVAHLGEAWKVLKKPHMPEPFLGEITNVPPRYYFAVYLVATAPLALLAVAAGGLGWLTAKRRRAAVIVSLWLLLPMAVSFSRSGKTVFATSSRPSWRLRWLQGSASKRLVSEFDTPPWRAHPLP